MNRGLNGLTSIFKHMSTVSCFASMGIDQICLASSGQVKKYSEDFINWLIRVCLVL